MKESKPNLVDKDGIGVVERANSLRLLEPTLDDQYDDSENDNRIDDKHPEDMEDGGSLIEDEKKEICKEQIPIILVNNEEEEFTETFPDEDTARPLDEETSKYDDGKGGLPDRVFEDLNKDILTVIIEVDDEGVIVENGQKKSFGETDSDIELGEIDQDKDLLIVRVSSDGINIHSLTVEEPRGIDGICKKVSFVTEDSDDDRSSTDTSSTESLTLKDEDSTMSKEILQSSYSDEIDRNENDFLRRSTVSGITKDKVSMENILRGDDEGEVDNDAYRDRLTPSNGTFSNPEKADNSPKIEQSSTINDKISHNIEPVSLCDCSYQLPKDGKIFQPDKSTGTSTPASVKSDQKIDRLEASIDPDILEQVYHAIDYEGLDFGPLEPLL